MSVTRISSAILAGGLVVGGAVVAAQQAGRNPDATPRRPAGRAVAAPTAAPTPPRSGGAEDEQAAVAKEISQLEVGLLDDEVKLIRTKVGDALKARVDYETSTATVDPQAWREAEEAYTKAREVFLKKSRDLAIARRRYGKPEETKGDDKGSGDDKGGADRGKKADGAASHASGAAVGSIDMEAVWKRYKKVARLNEGLKAEQAEAKGRLAQLGAEFKEAQALAVRKRRNQPGDPQESQRDEKLDAMRRRYESERDAAERELTRRQARDSASLLEDIQEAIAEVARGKGLDYVVKVSPGPRADADPDEVRAAMGRSVLYANPGHDITEEVIRALNRRYEPAKE